MEGIGFGHAAIFDGDAELVDNFRGGDLFVVDGSFELGMEILVLGAVFVYLLDGVETSDGGYELLTGYLVIAVEVYEVDPFSDLEIGLFWQKFFQALLELELGDAWFAVLLGLLEYDDGI